MSNEYTKRQYDVIDKRCKDKNVDTEQFIEYLSAFEGVMIDKAIDDFVRYNQADGYFDYGRKKQ